MKVAKFSLSLMALAAVAFTASANANHIAYEGFNSGAQDAPLSTTGATGDGFTGSWDITNGGGGASSYQSTGLSYPGTYPGSRVAQGGHGRVTGATGDSAFLALDLDAAADAEVNSASVIYISWLAQNVSESVSSQGILNAATRNTFNLAAEYPRNSGIRLMNVGNGDNSALGTIGNGGNWDGNDQSIFDVGDTNPEVVDTWAAFNFNDANNIFTGNGGKGPGVGTDPDPDYNPFPDNYLDVDHLVLRVDTANGLYNLWVNLQADGSSDGTISFQHTDGAVVPFEMHAFGLEAGNDSSDRPVGDLVVDEIWIADTFAAATGFAAPANIPEPTSALLMVCGLAGLGIRRRS